MIFRSVDMPYALRRRPPLAVTRLSAAGSIVTRAAPPRLDHRPPRQSPLGPLVRLRLRGRGPRL